MRERLAATAAQVLVAAGRRTGSMDPASAAALDMVVATLTADYGGAPQFDGSDEAADDTLGRMAETFGLDEAEQLIVAASVAADLDATFAVAYALLAGTPGTSAVGVGLALELAGIPTASDAAAGLLTPTSRLRRNRLIDIVGAGTWLGRTIVVPDRVRGHLLGSAETTAELGALVVEPVAFTSDASRRMAAALTVEPHLVHVHSFAAAAGLSTAVAGVAEAGFDCLAIDIRLCPARELGDRLHEAVREAGLSDRGLIVCGIDAVDERDDRSTVLAPLQQAPVPVVIVGSRAWDPTAMRTVPVTVQAPLLTGAERGAVWESALGSVIPQEPGHTSVSSLRLTPEQIVVTARYAHTLAAERSEPVSGSLVREAARILGAGSGAGRTVTRPPGPTTGFEDLILPPEVVSEIRRLVRWASYRDDVLRRGDIHGKGGKRSGIAALFTGGPGTGKTLAAHVVADELNLDLMQVDLSSVVDKYIGETEKNLERVFVEAESRNVILFFDEADALFGSRSAVNDARDRYANQEISYLLQRMEQFEGITVLATNLRGNLDPAFSRRMQFILHFPNPDEATRRRLWDLHLARVGGLDADDAVDVEQLAATLDLAGGDIRNVVLAAAYDAAADGRLVGMTDVRSAAEREYHKLGRLIAKV